MDPRQKYLVIALTLYIKFNLDNDNILPEKLINLFDTTAKRGLGVDDYYKFNDTIKKAREVLMFDNQIFILRQHIIPLIKASVKEKIK